MRRNLWCIGLAASALFASLCAPSTAQNVQCCSFRVRHNFKICLNNCPVQGVQWNWFAQASAWPPLTTNTNSGSQNYPIPSSDIKCASVAVGQDCAFATACARFQVNWIPGTQCVQGFHEAYGRACTRCPLFGAQAIAKSHITIQCGVPDPTGLIQWQPALDDVVGGECGVQNRDPVILRLRHSRTGERREITLFDLQASGFDWEAQDVDGDGWADSARIKLNDRPPRGHVTLLKRTASGGESRLHLRHENGIATESENTGEFSNLRWPAVGQPVPREIPVPETFDLPVETPERGWILEEVEMGGGGESGGTPPIPGDVNGDGCVDDADLLIVLFAFGGSDPNADVNGDGIVDDADLLIVLFNFGQGC